VNYLADSGSPLGSFVSDAVADKLGATTHADQATSSASWTTTGLTNPNAQKLAVTFTPQQAGYIHCRVMVAKASSTYYVDPTVTLS
jgi:hypothetical protein